MMKLKAMAGLRRLRQGSARRERKPGPPDGPIWPDLVLFAAIFIASFAATFFLVRAII